MGLDLKGLEREIERTLCRDRYALKRLLRKLPSPGHEDYHEIFRRLTGKIGQSQELVDQRRSGIPALVYPQKLPISKKREEIVETLRNNQVVVITGETGSGKTTQIPKMCLDAGRGVFGRICCTQPRRIAATSLTRQVAKELKSEPGEIVGHKIRFSEKSRESTLIQFVTDGILLAEIQSDRFLNNYDTIIIDEAHERTLNIDFLLGFLKRLLPKRPELKLIVTSATIDIEKFSKAFPQYYCPHRNGHFFYDLAQRGAETEISGAPIIQVSGRMYPVEVRYSPIDEIQEEQGDLTMIDLVQNAVEEILTETSAGDILVFMSGVQEIKETAGRLVFLKNEGFQVLPLFGRLSNDEQNRIFHTGGERKIILSTNIAETSITVPGIHYVIDSGRARISEYNTRSGTQGLPIKAISQSSADQRKGRCGRVSNGICIRLYSEEDYVSRPEYSTPEIQRSNLAEVILRMLSLRMGDIETFPFIDPPESAQIRAGYRTLRELGGLNEKRRLSPLGREMASLPVDPRTARMIVQAKKENVLYPVLIIASAISCQDPWERPEDKQTQADQKHAAFVSKESDLMTLLILWENYHNTLDELKTQGRMRKFCKANFLSYRRIREWRDIHRQLNDIIREKRWWLEKPNNWDYDAIHRSILSGYLTHIAQKKEKKKYQGTKNRELVVFPGSGQSHVRHDWIVAIELFETSKLFAHRVAKIDPEWLESLAGDLCRKSWTQPIWDRKNSRVIAFEKVTLFGFTLVEQRTVNYGNINLSESTEVFIREALVAENFDCELPFWRHNRTLIKRIREMENRKRKRDILVDDYILEKFYRNRISDVSCLDDLKRIVKRQAGDKFLFMKDEDIVRKEPDEQEELFPEHLTIGGKKCRLEYVFEPNHPRDGMTIGLPWSLLNSLQEEPFEYLVPGLLQEKILWLMKNLPKPIRKKIVPVSETAARTWETMTSLRYSTEQRHPRETSAKEFYQELSDSLFKTLQVYIVPEEWDRENLPAFLRMNFSVKNPRTQKVLQSRNLEDLRGKGWRKHDDWSQLVKPFERQDIKAWDFEVLLEKVPLHRQGDVALWGYRTLAMRNQELKLTLCRTREQAEECSVEAVSYFLERELGHELSWMYRELRFPPETLIHFQNLWAGKTDVSFDALQKKFGGNPNKIKTRFHEQLQQETYKMVCRGLCGYSGQPLLTQQAFHKRLESTKKEINGLGGRVVGWLNSVVELRVETIDTIQHKQTQRKGILWNAMLEELNTFISSSFLEEIPFEQWKHCPRIMRSYLRRVEKYANDPASEEQKYNEILPYQLKCEKLRGEVELAGVRKEWALKHLRWMLEELKISIFAQDLKTAFPISPKRLEKFLSEHFAEFT